MSIRWEKIWLEVVKEDLLANEYVKVEKVLKYHSIYQNLTEYKWEIRNTFFELLYSKKIIESQQN